MNIPDRGIKYCPNCGSPMKIKRKPMYDTETGRLLGYHLDISCKKWWTIHGSLVYGGYEGIRH